jgi:hypothetical protein
LEQTQYIRGQRLVKPWKLNWKLHGGLRFRDRGIWLGNCLLPPVLEAQHIVITGATRMGKSTLIRHMLAQLARRADAAIVFDPDSEFVQEFYDPARGDLILNPLDTRCPYWNPWSEFREGHTEQDIEAFVAGIFREVVNSREPFFRDAAKAVAVGLFSVCETIKDLMLALRQSPSGLQRMLQNTDAYSSISPRGDAQSIGVQTELTNKLRYFKHLPWRSQTTQTWSAREWSHRPKGWLFLTSRHDNRDATEVLHRLWLDSLTRCLLSNQIGEQRVWMFVDELPLLGFQPRLFDVLAGGLKRGLSLVLGFQTIAQLRRIYGQDGAISLISQAHTKVLFNGGEPETNAHSSNIIGKEDVDRTYTTKSRSKRGKSVSEAPRRIASHLVMPEEFSLMPKGRAYIAIEGYHRALLKVRQRDLKKKHPDFLPRKRFRGEQEGPEPAPEPVTAHPAFTPKPLPTASIWSNLEARCNQPAHVHWKDYGGRSKTDGTPDPVLLKFGSMDEIIALIGPRPGLEYTLDRIDPNKHYEPGNIRWLERGKQSANRRNSKKNGNGGGQLQLVVDEA